MMPSASAKLNSPLLVSSAMAVVIATVTVPALLNPPATVSENQVKLAQALSILNDPVTKDCLRWDKEQGDAQTLPGLEPAIQLSQQWQVGWAGREVCPPTALRAVRGARP